MKNSDANVCPVAEPDRVSRDSLLEHWLETPPRRVPSSRPPPSGGSERPTHVPIGDTVADDWFR